MSSLLYGHIFQTIQSHGRFYTWVLWQPFVHPAWKTNLNIFYFLNFILFCTSEPALHHIPGTIYERKDSHIQRKWTLENAKLPSSLIKILDGLMFFSRHLCLMFLNHMYFNISYMSLSCSEKMVHSVREYVQQYLLSYTVIETILQKHMPLITTIY